MGKFNKEGQIKIWGSFFKKGVRGSFATKHFITGYKNLIQMPKMLFLTYSHSHSQTPSLKTDLKQFTRNFVHFKTMNL